MLFYQVKGEFLHCYHKHCTLSAHVTCLGHQLVLNEGKDSPHLIPVSGLCPNCGQELLWGELIRQHKADEKTEGDAVDSVSTQKRKVING